MKLSVALLASGLVACVAGESAVAVGSSDPSGYAAPVGAASTEVERPVLPETIVFAARVRDAASFGLYTVRSDGTALTSLTSTDDREEMYPRWSPDRSHLAYIRAPADPSADGELVVANPDGTGAHVLTTLVASTRPGWAAPAWSPDGTEVMYPYPGRLFEFTDDETATFRTEARFHAMKISDGSDREYPPSGYDTMREPVWAQSGRVAFTDTCVSPDCADGETRWGVYDPNGGHWASTIHGHGVDISPDGALWVMALTELNPNWAVESSEDSGPIVLLTPSTCDYKPCTEQLATLTTAAAKLPRFSPDGTQIAFLDANGINVMLADGSARTLVFPVTSTHGMDW